MTSIYFDPTNLGILETEFVSQSAAVRLADILMTLEGAFEALPLHLREHRPPEHTTTRSTATSAAAQEAKRCARK